jgi:3-deoxy-D-manno-octulosonate 8-phosphate phosphatase KdsC-like HAD superfamily phosphatase
VPRAQLNLEKPTPLQIEQLHWIIITSENADEVFKRMEEQGIDPVLFGLTDKDFELLAKNFARIRNQLKITNDLLDKYKEYYESEDEKKESK